MSNLLSKGLKMDNIKMIWAKTPYFRNGGIGINALLAFDCFLKPEIFNLVKNSFEGYIQNNGRKTAIYNTQVINNLIQNGINVQLDGVEIKPAEPRPNDFIKQISDVENEPARYISNDELIKQSINSTNKQASRLARLYSEVAYRDNLVSGLQFRIDELFDNKQFIVTKKKEPADINWESARLGNVDMMFDFNYGVEKRIIYEERSHEDFISIEVYRSLNKEKIADLKNLFYEAKNNKPLVYDEDTEWQPGFNSETYESKKKQGYGMR